MPSRYVAVNAARTYLARRADVIINCTHTIAVYVCACECTIWRQEAIKVCMCVRVC